MVDHDYHGSSLKNAKGVFYSFCSILLQFLRANERKHDLMKMRADNPVSFSEEQVVALPALISTNISGTKAKYASGQGPAMLKDAPPAEDSDESLEMTAVEPTSAPRQPTPAGSQDNGGRAGNKNSIQTGSDSGDTESTSSASKVKPSPSVNVRPPPETRKLNISPRIGISPTVGRQSLPALKFRQDLTPSSSLASRPNSLNIIRYFAPATPPSGDRANQMISTSLPRTPRQSTIPLLNFSQSHHIQKRLESFAAADRTRMWGWA